MPRQVLDRFSLIIHANIKSPSHPQTVTILVAIPRRIICTPISFRKSPQRRRGKGDRILTLRTNHQTTSLLGTLVDRLDDIDQLLLVFEHPVQFIVVSGSEITHHMFVSTSVVSVDCSGERRQREQRRRNSPVEEHDGHRIEQFVHGVEFRHLVDVAEVNHGEVCAVVSRCGL